MDKKDDLIKVGKYDNKFNDILGIKIDELDIYRSKGLPTHMLKRKHYKCLKYIDYIAEIISNPDYIGRNPNEDGETIELVKKYKDNVLVGIKLDKKENYLYVSTMYDVQESKIYRRLNGGRLKTVPTDIDS